MEVHGEYTIEAQPTMHMVVYQSKDTMPLHVNTMVQNVSIPAITIIEQDGTSVQIDQEAYPTPTPQAKGGEKVKEKYKVRTKDSGSTVELEEVIEIQTLVSLPDTSTPLPSQALHRSST